MSDLALPFAPDAQDTRARTRSRKRPQTPLDLGAPDKFARWRPSQYEAVRKAFTSFQHARFCALALPTGSGKSLTAIAIALSKGWRVCYLTSTKGLQDQLLADFASIGLIDVRGQSNYECVEADAPKAGEDAVTVDHGHCQFGGHCKRRPVMKGAAVIEIPPPGVSWCAHYAAIRDANNAQLVVTNYAFWLHSQSRKTLGTFDLLVLDEAHDSVDQLSSFLSFDFTPWELERTLRVTGSNSHAPLSDDIEEWIAWAREKEQALTVESERFKNMISAGKRDRGTLRQARECKAALRKIEKLAKASTSAWACERVMQRKDARALARVEFNIIFPHEHAQALFLDCPRVLLMSATLRPMTLDLLGIDREDASFHEFAHTFPIEHRRVLHIPTVRLRASASEAELMQWVSRIDQIISKRLDRKGIVHTTSYARARFLMRRSRYRSSMITHATRDARDVIARFKAQTRPGVLVSPSVTTGFDFPGSECEYQIIGKIPFVDMRPKIMIARKQQWPEYGMYLAAQTIVQAAGRGVRYEADKCECFIVDDQALWFMKKFAHLMPQWFNESVELEAKLPKQAPESLLQQEMAHERV